MRSSLQVVRVFGIPIGINYSWIIIFALVTLSLSLYYFPSQHPDWPPSVYWTLGVATSLLFFISVLIHELSHSLVSVSQGIPVRSITLFVFGGVSNITSEPKSARNEFWMAIAGPLSSLGLAVVFGAIYLLSRRVAAPIASLANWLGWINLSLAVFNLIPGFPLDGGRVLRAIVWGATGSPYKATRIASLLGQVVAYGFILVGFFMALRGNWDGLWLAFVGWFLENAATQSYRQVALREALRGTTAGDLLTRECAYVPGELLLDHFVSEYLLPMGRRCFLVVDAGRATGMMTVHNVKEVPKSEWHHTRVDQAMTPLANLKRVKVNDDAATILEMMDEADVNQLPVVDKDGHLIGLITRDVMLHFIRTRTELDV